MEGISSSAIRCFSKQGAAVFYARYVAKTIEPQDTDAKRFGRAFHLAMSDPKHWRDLVSVVPITLEPGPELELIQDLWTADRTKAPLDPGEPINTRYKPHREYVELKKQLAAEAGKDWVTADQLAPLTAMIESVYKNRAAMEYVGHGRLDNVEVAGINTHGPTGLKVKALADLLLPRCIVDFKTTKAFTANEFIREALHKYSYHYQAAHYLEVFEMDSFKIISVRNAPPWECMVYDVPDYILATAKNANDAAMQRIKENYDMGDWVSPLWGSEIDLDDSQRLPQ